MPSGLAASSVRDQSGCRSPGRSDRPEWPASASRNQVDSPKNGCRVRMQGVVLHRRARRTAHGISNFDFALMTPDAGAQRLRPESRTSVPSRSARSWVSARAMSMTASACSRKFRHLRGMRQRRVLRYRSKHNAKALERLVQVALGSRCEIDDRRQASRATRGSAQSNLRFPRSAADSEPDGRSSRGTRCRARSDVPARFPLSTEETYFGSSGRRSRVSYQL